MAVGAGDPAFGRFVYAIRQQESGDNYTRVSPAGALGAYQVMPFNVGNWSQQIIGHPVTVAEFMASPQLQDEIAQGKLLQYYNAYGARGAAAAWYSGNPQAASDYTVDRWGQSPGNYADQVLGKMGSAPADSITSTSSDLPAAPYPVDSKHQVTINGTVYDAFMHPESVPADAAVTMAQYLRSVEVAYHANTKSGALEDAYLTIIHSTVSDVVDKGSRSKTKLAGIAEVYVRVVKPLSAAGPFPGSGTAGQVTDVLSKIFGILTSSSFWRRVGMGALGAAILIGMMYWVEKNSGAPISSRVRIPHRSRATTDNSEEETDDTETDSDE